ncbi:MAG: DUF1983 domain-containing protein [Pseudomonas sp.]|nr:DUF1983 domain-containing protein [Pseudomonas sp.]
MSEGWVCGTGGGNFPKPGDPDSNVILKATPAFGGIDVEWTFPNINPHAVAHTILYRSTSDNVDSAVRHAIVNGNFFYDKTTTATLIRYYYWIQIVSVNGTYSEMIGPASAIARPTTAQMIELLTGQIDAGVLAESLKTEIGKIELNRLAVNEELLALAEQDDALGAAYNEVVAFTENTRSLLQQETLARAEANSAFVTQIQTLYAEMEGVSAGVQDETDARIKADQALATRITTAQSQLGDNIASVQQTFQTSIDTVNGKVTEIGAMYTAKVDVNGLIGGFGVYNNGKTVEAGFDVDRFWVGRTTNKRKPFIIENNEVFIDEAAINKLTFSKLRDESGSFVVKDGKVQAQYLTVDTASIRDAAITSAKIKDASIETAKIKDLAVDTLKIRGNAVTVPVGMSGYGAVPEVAITLDVPGMVMVIVMANFLATGGGAASCFVQATAGGQAGAEVGVTAPSGGSTSAVAFGSFWLPAGTHVCGGNLRVTIGNRTVHTTGIFAMGIKR